MIVLDIFDRNRPRAGLLGTILGRVSTSIGRFELADSGMKQFIPVLLTLQGFLILSKMSPVRCILAVFSIPGMFSVADMPGEQFRLQLPEVSCSTSPTNS
jgi:hypothetical protein